MKIYHSIFFLFFLFSCSTKSVKEKVSPQIDVADNTEDLIVLKDTSSLYSVKILESKKDTLVDIEFLKQDFIISTEIEFNYPKLQNKKVKDQLLVISNDSIIIKLKENKFDSLAHSFTYEDTFKFPKKYGLRKIDNEIYYGSDGEMPKTEIGEIIIKQNNNSYKLSRLRYKNLFNPRFSSIQTDVYIANNNRIILSFWASDGAGGYVATMFIKNNKIEEVVIDRGF